MTRPRLVACYFGDGHESQWPRMARVLEHSARTHCSTWSIEIRKMNPDPTLLRTAREVAEAANTQKLEHWIGAIVTAKDDDQIMLIDVDTVILRTLDEVWDRTFDLAYTTKPGPYPFNAGVMFVRVNDRVRQFARVWLAENERMFADRAYHLIWKRIYGGINQAALGATIAKTFIRSMLEIRELPCVEWNCEDQSWSAFDPSVTRILHIKTALRRACFNLAPTPLELQPLMRRWRELEKVAGNRPAS